MENEKNQLIYWSFMSAIFIIILIMPISDSMLHFTRDITINEQRVYAKAPEFKDLNISLINFMNVSENYYNDHFSARAVFIKVNSYLKYYLFSSSITDKVVIGKQGWIYNTGSANCLSYSKPFSNETLFKWKDYLEEMDKFSAKNNLTFVFVIVPSKETIYPEYFPEKLKLFNNKTDEIISYLKEKTNITIIDLRKDLLGKKDSYRLFYAYDLHWTNTASYFGYLGIMKKLKEKNKNLEIYNLSNFKVNNITKIGFLARMIGMENTLLETDEHYTFIKKNFNRTDVNQTKNNSIILTYEIETSSNNNSKPNILLKGDSFLASLVDFIAPSGNNVTFIINDDDKNNNIESIKRQNISIIIYERFEHNFLNPEINSFLD